MQCSRDNQSLTLSVFHYVALKITAVYFLGLPPEKTFELLQRRINALGERDNNEIMSRLKVIFPSMCRVAPWAGTLLGLLSIYFK